MGRARREGYSPPPTDYANANDSHLSERYSAKEFIKYYQGLVYGAGEGEKALIFASLENIAKLGEATKTILSDATFNTVPKMVIVKEKPYQILIVYAEYNGHVFPILKAIMNRKTRTAYDSVYCKLKELLPDSVKPSLVVTDYEQALQGAMAAVFPEARIVGCWFHYSQVRSILYHLLATSCQLKYLHLQAVFKNMTHLGLLPTFRENQAFTLWLELCMALPLLPEHDIEEAWNELKTMPVADVPAQPFRKFKSYITKTWIQQRLHVLSVYGQVREIIFIYWQLVAN